MCIYYIYMDCAWHASTPAGPKAAIKPVAQQCEGEVKLDPGAALQRACAEIKNLTVPVNLRYAR